MNLKKTLALLAKEGRIELQKQWLPFTHPNKKDEFRGDVLLQMQIIPMSEAEQNPVGEAWDEPNENPKLVKPTDGRGLGARFQSAVGIDLSKIKLPSFNLWRNIMILAGIGGTVATIMFTLMFALR